VSVAASYDACPPPSTWFKLTQALDSGALVQEPRVLPHRGYEGMEPRAVLAPSGLRLHLGFHVIERVRNEAARGCRVVAQQAK